MIIGSRARNDHTADAWSDLDLILFVGDTQAYVQDARWIASFGEVWLQVLNFTGAGDPEWLVLFAGGFKVDFILAPVTGSLLDSLADSFYAAAARRGFRILLDKGGDEALAESRLAAMEEWERPSEEEFELLLNKFWLSVYRASTMVLRGELWRARAITDGPMRQQLLGMLEWHAKARMGSKYDTWYDGRFLSDWVEPQKMALLPEIFAPFNAAGAQQRNSSSHVTDGLAGAADGRKWGYLYPIANQIPIQDWIEASLSGNKSI